MQGASSPATVDETCVQEQQVDKEEEIEQLRTCLQKATKQLHEKDDQIVRLCHQVSQGQLTASDDFHSAPSTPQTSMSTELSTGTTAIVEEPSTHTAEHRVSVSKEGMFSTSDEPPYVSRLRKALAEHDEQWKKAEKRAEHFEKEYFRVMNECPSLKLAAEQGEGVGESMADMTVKLGKAEANVTSLKKHSQMQSQQIFTLQNEAKVKCTSIVCIKDYSH